VTRARDLGIPLEGEPGPGNALTDVPGVEVGHVTLIEGDGPLRVGHGPVRTGVTAVLPLGRGGVGQACAAGWFSLNGNGEMTGTAWLEESGGLALPVLLSNTHAIGACHRGVIDWLVARHPMTRAAMLIWRGFCWIKAGISERTKHLPSRWKRSPAKLPLWPCEVKF